MAVSFHLLAAQSPVLLSCVEMQNMNLIQAILFKTVVISQ